MKKEIELLEIVSELGAGTRGASLGVGALKVAAFNKKSDFFNRYESVKVRDFNQFVFEKNKTPNAIRIEHILKEFVQISGSVCSTLERGKFPFLLSGDHSTAAATIAGIKKYDPNARLGVIWIDAHADIHSPYTSPSGNVHGMPLAVATHIDNLDRQINNITGETQEYWEKLKHLGGKKPNLNPEDIVYIGVRDAEEPEKFLIDKHGIKNFEVAEVKTLGAQKVVNQTLDILNECDIIYVSFDVDSMDPEEISSGTGTPVKNGIPHDIVQNILLELSKVDKLCCFEIVEINPCLDNKLNTMAETAFNLIDQVAKTIEE